MKRSVPENNQIIRQLCGSILPVSRNIYGFVRCVCSISATNSPRPSIGNHAFPRAAGVRGGEGGHAVRCRTGGACRVGNVDGSRKKRDCGGIVRRDGNGFLCSLFPVRDADCPLAGCKPLEHRQPGRVGNLYLRLAVLGDGDRRPRRGCDGQRGSRTAGTSAKAV